MRYMTVEGKPYDHHSGSFDEKVQQAINRGWRPTGGLAFDSHNRVLFQAMTLEGEEIVEDWRLAP